MDKKKAEFPFRLIGMVAASLTLAFSAFATIPKFLRATEMLSDSVSVQARVIRVGESEVRTSSGLSPRKRDLSTKRKHPSGFSERVSYIEYEFYGPDEMPYVGHWYFEGEEADEAIETEFVEVLYRPADPKVNAPREKWEKDASGVAAFLYVVVPPVVVSAFFLLLSFGFRMAGRYVRNGKDSA